MTAADERGALGLEDTAAAARRDQVCAPDEPDQAEDGERQRRPVDEGRAVVPCATSSALDGLDM